MEMDVYGKSNQYAVCDPKTMQENNTEDMYTVPMYSPENSDQKSTPKCRIQLQFAFYPALLLLMLAIVVLKVLTIANLRLVPATSYECNIPAGSLNNTGEQNSCVIEEQAEQLSELLIAVDEQWTSIKNNTEEVLEFIQLMQVSVHELTKLTFQSPISISCQEIKQKQPWSTSGYYYIKGVLTYCHMEMLCNDAEGGWTRLGHFNISDSNVSCPSEFKPYYKEEVRVCGRSNKGPGCSSIKIPSNGISYSQVCGRVVGYQYGLPDAVTKSNTNDSADARNDINSHYVDGVSITQGDPRKHIWTLMAGNSSYNNSGNCPCNSSSSNEQEVQSFVGEDYF